MEWCVGIMLAHRLKIALHYAMNGVVPIGHKKKRASGCLNLIL